MTVLKNKVAGNDGRKSVEKDWNTPTLEECFIRGILVFAKSYTKLGGQKMGSNTRDESQSFVGLEITWFSMRDCEEMFKNITVDGESCRKFC